MRTITDTTSRRLSLLAFASMVSGLLLSLVIVNF